MNNQRFFVQFLLACFLTISMLGVGLAQEETMIDPLDLSSEPLILEFSNSATGPPMIEPLSDGRMTFRITGAGPVTGSIQGTFTGRITEVTSNPSPPYHPVTVLFTVETEQGVIEGFYAGSFHLPDGADHSDVNATGQILSVSGAYADLYLADVYVTSQVQFVDGRSVGESGTMTIAPR